jgi:hypothetical protein
MQRLWRDPRFRARRLMKQPMFILIAVWTLALSTGFTQIKTTTIPLDNPNELQPRNVKNGTSDLQGAQSVARD